ncbi:OLC1v1003691C1 [Oldenlandia corymbosa var. corymbosa]|uniref:OLC1v1003691C1 n=1 Tax=Oldenlandia corymbosa var. corymbosa TaxID=529605 RepID=A0AAV1DCG2_OLDCO|nr:OLC1v1003691C1 [Oldenlandia corymbosa var. corymbosa]
MLLHPIITLNPPSGYGGFISFSLSSSPHVHTSKPRPPPSAAAATGVIISSKPLAPFKLATAAVAAAMIFSLVTAPFSAATAAAEAGGDNSETLSNIPQTLSSGEECSPSPGGDCKKSRRIQRPKSKKAENCTVKCLNTCIRGGYGSPGEGPLNIRRPLVVFKDTFRSRTYCLMECSEICNLIGDLDDGP